MTGFTLQKSEIEKLRHYGSQCFMVYVACLRPFLNYKTGIVGQARRISLRMITEYLYMPSSQGRKEQSLTREGARRLLRRMHDGGMIKIICSKKLHIELPHAKFRSLEAVTETREFGESANPLKLQVVNPSKSTPEIETSGRTMVHHLTNQCNIIPKFLVRHSGDMCITTEDKMYEQEKPLKTLIPSDWQPNKVNIQLCSDLKLSLSRQVQKFIKYNQTKGSRFDEWDTIFSSWLQRAQIFAERRRNTKKVSTDKKTDSFDYAPYLLPKTALSQGFSNSTNICTIYVQSFEECRDLIKNKLKSNIRTVNEKTALRFYIPIYQRLIMEKRDAERKS